MKQAALFHPAPGHAVKADPAENLRPKKQWIPVSDRIPVESDANTNGQVWYYDPDEKRVGLVTWKAAGFLWGRKPGGIFGSGFSHWMVAESPPNPPV